MITQAIINFFINIFVYIVDLLPESLSGISIPSNIFSALDYLGELSAYFLPIADIALIFGFMLAITNWRLIYSIVMRIWDALPLT